MEFIERDSSNFWNHGCDPNCWFINDGAITTLRDVQVRLREERNNEARRNVIE